MTRNFTKLITVAVLATALFGLQSYVVRADTICPSATSATSYISPTGYGYTQRCDVTQTGAGSYWHVGTTDAQVGPASIAVYVSSHDYITVSYTDMTPLQNCNDRATGTVSTYGYSIQAQTAGASSITCSGTSGTDNFHWYDGLSVHTRESAQTTSQLTGG